MPDELTLFDDRTGRHVTPHQPSCAFMRGLLTVWYETRTGRKPGKAERDAIVKVADLTVIEFQRQLLPKEDL